MEEPDLWTTDRLVDVASQQSRESTSRAGRQSVVKRAGSPSQKVPPVIEVVSSHGQQG